MGPYGGALSATGGRYFKKAAGFKSSGRISYKGRIPMQRMLVALVLVLVAAVCGLGAWVFELSAEVDGATRRAATDPAPNRGVSVAEAAESTRVQALENELAKLRGDVRGLRIQLENAERVAEAARRAAGSNGGAEGGEPPAYGTLPEGGDPFADPERDASGEFVITDEAEAYFLAVQERVQRRRRIDGMVRNVMRRVERLATRGEIAALPADRMAEVEKTIRKYVLAGDDLVTSYVREPDATKQALTAEQRRDQLAAERTQLVEQAQRDLVPLVGEVDAVKVAEESLQNPWGLRRDRGLGGTGRR